MATIKEIAQLARVSIGTVSNVINGTAVVSPRRRERVLAAIRELDYHPNQVARSLKLKTTRMLGMVISDITNPFFPQLVRGAEDVALKHNYLLITFNTDDNLEREKQVLSVLRQRRVDGVLLVVAPNVGNDSHIRDILKAGVPTVCLDRVPAGIDVDSVSVDNVSGAHRCVQHLASMGHRRIAILTGPARVQTAAERLQGYKQALLEAGLPIRPELIREGDFRSESGYQLGRELLAGADRPTAVFVGNNMMSLGLLRALGELGLRCPEDIAVAMFDDFPFADAFRPRLTAVAQPAYSIGYRGAELLIERIEKKRQESVPIRIRLSTDLMIRESSAGYRFPPLT
jgi:LacI family transcriptional regulator